MVSANTELKLSLLLLLLSKQQLRFFCSFARTGSPEDFYDAIIKPLLLLVVVVLLLLAVHRLLNMHTLYGYV